MRQRMMRIGMLLLGAAPAIAQEEWVAKLVNEDLSKIDHEAACWKEAKVKDISLMAQPMVSPRPKECNTPGIKVQALHDGKHLALRFVWKDVEKSEAGRPGEYSDALAVQFPALPVEVPPVIFMGTPGNGVHIFHWRAQYQRDHEKGKPTMKDLYPNMSIDMYPMEYTDQGTVGGHMVEAREQFSPGRAVGNPQSFPKTGVDEIVAEGFSTSSVQKSATEGVGRWANGEWTLIMVRPLVREGGSTLTPGQKTFTAFAVWQGGHGEVGSRKSVTMTWTNLLIEKGVTAGD